MKKENIKDMLFIAGIILIAITGTGAAIFGLNASPSDYDKIQPVIVETGIIRTASEKPESMARKKALDAIDTTDMKQMSASIKMSNLKKPELSIKEDANNYESISEITMPSDEKPVNTNCIEPKKPYYVVTDEEFEILCRLTEAEAEEGDKKQKMNVTSCVFARMEHDGFPDNVKDVVFEKGQFSVIRSGERGRYYEVEIKESTREAVREVINNGKTHSCIFFCATWSKSTYFANKEAKLKAEGLEPYNDGIHKYFQN